MWAQLVIFDLDDTLVDTAGGIDAWLVELVAERALGPAGLAFLRAEQEREVSAFESYRAIIEEFGFSESPAELQAIFRRRTPLLTKVFDGVTDGLLALREHGWRTAVLTNGSEARQRLKMHDGLDTLFDTVCFAQDEVVSKPDAAAFELTAARAGAPLAGAWMVGDLLGDDIAPCAALGMRTIWVSHGAALPTESPVRPDAIVETTAEAFPILLSARLDGNR